MSETQIFAGPDELRSIGTSGARLLDRAWTSYRKGRLRTAQELTRQIINQHPDFAPAWFVMGQIAGAQQNADDAISNMQKSVDLNPANATYQTYLGRFLFMNGQTRSALEALGRAAELDPNDTLTCYVLGNMLTHAQEQKKALPFLERAAKGEPENPDYLYALAEARRHLGSFAEAKNTYEQVLKRRPKDADAWFNLASLATHNAQDNHIQKIEELVGIPDIDWLARVKLLYALAKELEDLGQYDESFQRLTEAGSLQKQRMPYDVERDLSLFDDLARKFNGDAFGNAQPGCKNDEPIFIVGMPRSGTTLIDRIFSSHSKVYSAGELPNFAFAFGQALMIASKQTGGFTFLNNDMIANALEVDFEKLGESFIESTRPRTGHTPHFLDKLPQNFLYCGLVKMALPNAKIIHSMRNPMDLCFSNYKQWFNQTSLYANDLQDLGRYYLGYVKMMAHWHDVMPGAILDIAYEDIVGNPESEVRRLLDHCGLDWEPACLAFHENPEPSATASAVQVRRPLYDTSIERWKKYETQLGPLKRLLETHGVTFE